MFENVPTPTLLVDEDRLRGNIQRMQAVCDAHGVELWPHIKTHKMLEVARLQLAAGARGLVCAKIGEAEVMRASGTRAIFLAYPLVDPLQGPRLRDLADSLEELIVACTSVGQAQALARVLVSVGLRLPVMAAVDTGLGREGARSVEEAVELADYVRRQPCFTLRGFFTHEGHVYGTGGDPAEAIVAAVRERLMQVRERTDPSLPVWPGCSRTAHRMATLPGISAVRPGTYVFGDLSLVSHTPVMEWDDLALTILCTVADLPEPGLALLDAGSKTFTSDKTRDTNVSGSFYDRRDVHVTKCSEEHGFANGSEVAGLRIGERVRVVPAHVCPVVNLADEVAVLRGGEMEDTWRVAARGRVQ